MIDEIKKSILDLVNTFNKEDTIDKYNIMISIYKKIESINDMNELKSYLDELKKESKTLKIEYDKLIEEYNKIKKTNNREEINKLIKKINPISRKIDAYNRIINISRINTNNINNSDKIIELLDKYNTLDKSTSEAIKLRKTIYELRKSRENIIKKEYGSDSIRILYEIQSLEDRVSFSTEKIKDYRLTYEDYIKKMNELINAINEYNYIGYKEDLKYYKYNTNKSDNQNENRFIRKYNYYLKEFNNILKSLFNDEDIILYKEEDSNVLVTLSDLISYINCYNLDKDYNLFLKKYNNSRIGNELINKKDYLKSIDIINKCISNLYEISKRKFESEIIIKDYSESRNDLIKEINNNYKELGKKKIIEGEKNVHR